MSTHISTTARHDGAEQPGAAVDEDHEGPGHDHRHHQPGDDHPDQGPEHVEHPTHDQRRWGDAACAHGRQRRREVVRARQDRRGRRRWRTSPRPSAHASGRTGPGRSRCSGSGRAAGQHVHLDVVGHRLHLVHEPVPPADLEGHRRHLPRLGRGLERLLDPPDLEHEDAGGAQRQGPTDRDGVHQPAVEEVPVADPHRREQSGHRARRDDRVGEVTLGEPHRAGVLDAGGDALEGHLEVLEPARPAGSAR